LQIDWIIPCRYVEVHDNLGTIVGAGIDTVWAPNLPAAIQMTVAVRLLALADELGPPDHQHTARNLITGPDGATVGDVSVQFGIGTENPREDWLNGFILPAIVQFEAQVEGTYTLEHQVDAASSSVPIHIVHGLPPGAEPPA
jgi:hypothetical protein